MSSLSNLFSSIMSVSLPYVLPWVLVIITSIIKNRIGKERDSFWYIITVLHYIAIASVFISLFVIYYRLSTGKPL